MADRLTQLQDAVNQQGRTFATVWESCSSLLHPVSSQALNDLLGKLQTPSLNHQKIMQWCFPKLIARTAKDIDVLIESLPSEESSLELQLSSLQRLEAENQDSANRLEDVVKKGEDLLSEIQLALQDIAQAQLQSQALESSMANAT